MIAQALTAEIAARYREHGEDPPVLVSANVDGADDHNARLRARYGARIGWELRGSQQAHPHFRRRTRPQISTQETTHL